MHIYLGGGGGELAGGGEGGEGVHGPSPAMHVPRHCSRMSQTVISQTGCLNDMASVFVVQSSCIHKGINHTKAASRCFEHALGLCCSSILSLPERACFTITISLLPPEDSGLSNTIYQHSRSVCSLHSFFVPYQAFQLAVARQEESSVLQAAR